MGNNNIELAFTLLLAGFVIVFVVLILLIVIITLYGKIIQSAQNAVSKKKTQKQTAQQNSSDNPSPAPLKAIVREELNEDDGTIPEEIVAVIAAAVDAVYGSKPHKIKNIRRSRSIRSSWGNAGIAENTKPF